MLRFFERYKQRVKTWVKGNSILDWILFGSWVLVALAIGTMVFFTFDITPATPEDYEPLVSRALLVEEYPIKMLEQNGNIRIVDDKISLEIENEECEIVATYNRNFKFLGVEKKDKSHPVAFAIIASGICGYLGGFVIVSIMVLFQLIYSTVSYYLSELIYKWQLKRNKRH